MGLVGLLLPAIGVGVQQQFKHNLCCHLTFRGAGINGVGIGGDQSLGSLGPLNAGAGGVGCGVHHVFLAELLDLPNPIEVGLVRVGFKSDLCVSDCEVIALLTSVVMVNRLIPDIECGLLLKDERHCLSLQWFGLVWFGLGFRQWGRL